MIDVKVIELESPNPPLAIRITLRNGFTYLMVVIARQASSFVNYDGFEKFLKEQTIRTKTFSTIKLTWLVEKEQVNLIPCLVSHLSDQPIMLPPEQQLYYSVSLYKSDIKKHPSPSEAPKITIPIINYGMDLYDPINHNRIGYISNLFYFREHRYYLCELEQTANNTSVVANSKGFPIGLVIKYDSVTVCLSCRDLLDPNKDYSQFIPTDDITRSWLMRTTYIQSNGFYGTGVLIDHNKIISAKHIVPENSRQVGQTVHIGLYPYTKTGIGTITFVDTIRDYIEIQVSPQDIIPEMRPLTKDTSYSLGRNIVAIGFGKYNYSIGNFREGTMLPTLHKGIISKLIMHNLQNIFIKTDVHLSNGFSGCGIWTDRGLAAMAVFIIVNGQKRLFWHNYSYTIDLIQQKDCSHHQQYLIDVDKIYLRKALPIYPKL